MHTFFRQGLSHWSDITSNKPKSLTVWKQMNIIKNEFDYFILYTSVP